MKFKNKPLRIACDGESASGKSFASKAISKKYKLFCLNSGLLFRFASLLILKYKPKKIIPFLKKKFKNLNYNKITQLNLHTQKISNHVVIIAQKKNVRNITKTLQKKMCKTLLIFYLIPMLIEKILIEIAFSQSKMNCNLLMILII